MRQHCILAGHNKGRMYADDLEHSNCALVWAEQEIFYLIGDPQRHFAAWTQVVEEDLKMFFPKPFLHLKLSFTANYRSQCHPLMQN